MALLVAMQIPASVLSRGSKSTQEHGFANPKSGHIGQVCKGGVAKHNPWRFNARQLHSPWPSWFPCISWPLVLSRGTKSTQERGFANPMAGHGAMVLGQSCPARPSIHLGPCLPQAPPIPHRRRKRRITMGFALWWWWGCSSRFPGPFL